MQRYRYASIVSSIPVLWTQSLVQIQSLLDINMKTMLDRQMSITTTKVLIYPPLQQVLTNLKVGLLLLFQLRKFLIYNSFLRLLIQARWNRKTRDWKVDPRLSQQHSIESSQKPESQSNSNSRHSEPNLTATKIPNHLNFCQVLVSSFLQSRMLAQNQKTRYSKLNRCPTALTNPRSLVWGTSPTRTKPKVE